MQKSKLVIFNKFFGLVFVSFISVLITGWILKEIAQYRYISLNESKIKLAIEQVKALENAVHLYQKVHGFYPHEGKLATTLKITTIDLQVKKGKFIDPWGRQYLYRLSAKKKLGTYPDRDFIDKVTQPFYLWSYGPDKRDANWGKNKENPLNKDNICNW